MTEADWIEVAAIATGIVAVIAMLGAFRSHRDERRLKLADRIMAILAVFSALLVGLGGMYVEVVDQEGGTGGGSLAFGALPPGSRVTIEVGPRLAAPSAVNSRGESVRGGPGGGR